MPTHACGYMMYSNTLLVQMNQRVLSKPSKDSIISMHKWSMIQRVLKSHGSKMSIIYTLNHKKMCNRTSYTCVHELLKNCCGDNGEGTLFSWLHVYIMSILHLIYININIYIYIYIYIYVCMYMYIIYIYGNCSYRKKVGASGNSRSLISIQTF